MNSLSLLLGFLPFYYGTFCFSLSSFIWSSPPFFLTPRLPFCLCEAAGHASPRRQQFSLRHPYLESAAHHSLTSQWDKQPYGLPFLAAKRQGGWIWLFGGLRKWSERSQEEIKALLSNKPLSLSSQLLSDRFLSQLNCQVPCLFLPPFDSKKRWADWLFNWQGQWVNDGQQTGGGRVRLNWWNLWQERCMGCCFTETKRKKSGEVQNGDKLFYKCNREEGGEWVN